MGIKANATAVINLDGAKGYLIGEVNKGLSCMFTMMNAARLGCGMQGLGIGEASFQGALAYARERLQMRSLSGDKCPDKPADPIIVHPDVRRMLLTQKAYTEAGRALTSLLALQLDIEDKHPDADARQDAADLVALLTPVAKAFMTDNGYEAANLGMQVFGGHGYIREWGMEQLVRDCRISQIYEGTNGIQAIDLLGRKVLMDQGQKLRKFTKQIHKFCQANEGNDKLADYAAPLAAVEGRGRSDHGHRHGRHAEPRRSRRGRHRLPAPDRPPQLRLAVGANGGSGSFQAGRRRRRLLPGQDPDRPLLYG